MATTVISTEQTVTRPTGIKHGGNAPPGNGPRGGRGGPFGGGGDEGGDSARHHLAPDHRYRIGMWVALCSITMLFTALTSAYIVRSRLNTANDWQPIDVPQMLWLSTSLILLSSATFEGARRYLRRGDTERFRLWLLATVLLGLGFLATQWLAWRELVAQGIYLTTNPHSSFFYLLTAVHALHLMGGILMLGYLLWRAWAGQPDGRSRRSEQRASRQKDSAAAVALYWHFMDGLWVYLFLLLFLWR